MKLPQRSMDFIGPSRRRPDLKDLKPRFRLPSRTVQPLQARSKELADTFIADITDAPTRARPLAHLAPLDYKPNRDFNSSKPSAAKLSLPPSSPQVASSSVSHPPATATHGSLLAGSTASIVLPAAEPASKPAAASKSKTKRILSAQEISALISRTGINRQQLISISLVTAVFIALGVYSQDLSRGQQAIAVYAVLALIFKLDSRLSFMLGLFGLVLTAMLRQAPLAANFAVYTYFFLVIGVLSTINESWRESRHKRKGARS